MWEPQHLTTLWASTACYRDSFTLALGKHNAANLYTLLTIKQEEQWRIRNNEEIDEILKKENIVTNSIYKYKKNRLAGTSRKNGR
jgi:hypothetical protein